MAEQFLLSDLRISEPASALSRVPGPDQWGTYEYETASVRGVALYCRPFANPPELTIPISGVGWHRIYVGIHYGHTYDSYAAKLKVQVPDQFIWLRLSSDRAHDLIEPEYYPASDAAGAGHAFGFTDIVQVLWRCADVTGQTLHVAPRRTARYPGPPAGIAWLRLEQMTAAEIEAETSGSAGDTRRLIYIADTDLHEAWPTAVSDVQRLLEPLAGSDFSHVLWTTSLGDICSYPSPAFPRAFVVDGADSPYGYPHSARTPSFDVLAAVADVCHELGLRVHGLMRPVASRMPPLHWPRAEHNLFHDHPELRQSGRGGEPVGHYSFAHPRVRETLLAVLREQVTRYPLDGVHLLFNRGWPFVGYEQHVVDAFMQAHGDDPRDIDPRDPRWLRHKSGYMSLFVGDVRRMLDEVSRQRGRRLELSVTVMAGLEQCMLLGLDVAHWLAEGWIDHLVIHPCWLPNRWQDTDVSATMSVTPERIAEVVDLAAVSGCRVYPDVYPRYIGAVEYARRAAEYYAAGADGLCFWDTYCRVPRKSEWSAIRRLGHVDKLADLTRCAESFRTVVSLVSAAGMSLDPAHTPGTNG